MDLIFMESVWWVFAKPLRRALFVRISSDPEDRFTPRPVLARCSLIWGRTELKFRSTVQWAQMQYED
ncbi:hypothetical protein ACB098_04G021600 [Castanea mollissima]